MVFKNWDRELTEENILDQIAKAKQEWQESEATEPRAESVSYDESDNLIIIKLKNGAIFSFPPRLAQGLESASPEQLADVWLPPSGSSIHWESLDVDFSIPELVAGIFGTKAWMAELGRKGGKVTSTAKASAAKKNGQKGGRPKKNPINF
ncbi:MAG TPA: DUF2442 domain-containing protein [Cyanobacteria bacterium UBA11149]|nr:DUF2442 domain-containing protein [Cyanobacteria bacterium UBA11367]HBE57483.1 DUF2442 domain-containing protein [Cyanobacteria bacterium UBA11366]HBK66387.1 DUF2442 domain-containing protein [Cyanobacteria bacterium UBA11166]HBR73577.1 DUF2442 domain-containing protein [Cyanobacteria bacterium UBA11159]HBS71150.1 DUF2442 domain-containing protein [Cyanobacteria bacterium UBA11153]HBW89057.1 DUF2442 domain-containing protein [Cyanobacteria bacterium UBA11149]HCA93650.1 DUF2442 domain-conta